MKALPAVLLFVLLLPPCLFGQSGKPQTIIVPTGSLGEVSEVRVKILEKTLESKLDDYFDIVPKDLFEEAQEQAFQEMELEECTEEQCIMMIREILQVENSFQLVLMVDGGDTQISLTWNDLDKKRVEEEYCEGCKTKELRESVGGLVERLIKVGQQQPAEKAKKLEAERRRLEAEKQQLAEAKRKAEEEKRVIAKKREAEWQRITALIKQKDFREAQGAIQRWQNSGDAPANLNKLSTFLESEEQREQERIAKEQEQKLLAKLRKQEQLATQREQERIATRPTRVRQLIESGQFKQAEGEFTKWIAEGVDTEKRLELAAFFNQRAPRRFVEIPGGSFAIGDQFDEGTDDEKPGWFYGDIDIQPFQMGETEVTQAQWQAIMNNNPANFKGDDLPVENVSWKDIQQFIKKLNARSGKRFRLPTEAEWEYACREGGRKVRFCNGRDEASKSGIHYGSSKTKPVASFAQNSLGLYDMSGNVFEWTCSAYTKSYDGSEQKCSVSASKYSLRGGSWDLKPGGARAANRVGGSPDARGNFLGFRLAQD
jgi:formylglycine-generating enzyme required for sulfatase activity